MKTLIVKGAVILCSVLSVSAQGTITLENLIPGVLRAPFYGPELFNVDISKVGNTSTGIPPGNQVYTGSLLGGSNWRAQLLAAPGMVSADALVAVGATTGFRTGTAAGFMEAETIVLPFGEPTTPVATFAVAVWDNSSGLFPTWSEAKLGWVTVGLYAARSPLYFAPPSGTTSFLESFNVYHVPEPAGLALLFLGLGSGLLLRRR